MISTSFIITNMLLGVGLAMDAFSVSIVNTLNEPSMERKKMCLMALVYGVFQFAMPLIGWLCVHTIIGYFEMFVPFIPWVALILLVIIGGKMLLEGFGVIEDFYDDGKKEKLTIRLLMLQGFATAIDALSVGFTIAEYGLSLAITASIIIGVVTFIITLFGAEIGKKIGNKLSSKASVLGGAILILIGIKICFF